MTSLPKAPESHVVRADWHWCLGAGRPPRSTGSQSTASPDQARWSAQPGAQALPDGCATFRLMADSDLAQPLGAPLWNSQK